MKISRHFIYVIGLFLSCSSPTYTLEGHEDIIIGIEAEKDSSIMAIISPYQQAIESEMNEVITYTKYNLEKGKPQSTMGNFVTDLCLEYTEAHICVMNNGGLRTNITKGEITRGKIYELMPFENELVVLELSKDNYIGLLNYITKRGGEPFSGITIEIDENGNMLSNSWPVDFENNEKVKVLTSDYLANGGDKMSFFKNKKQMKVGIKLRDAIIDYCIRTDTIDVKIDDRIKVIIDE